MHTPQPTIYGYGRNVHLWHFPRLKCLGRNVLGQNVRNPLNVLHLFYIYQWHSQNSEKVTHIKGDSWNKAVILFGCTPFQNRNFSQRKEFAPGGSWEQILPFKSSSLWYGKSL